MRKPRHRQVTLPSHTSTCQWKSQDFNSAWLTSEPLPIIRFWNPWLEKLRRIWHVRSLEMVTPVLTTKRSWTNWKSTALLRTIRELRSRGKPLPPNLERQAGTENHSLVGNRSPPLGASTIGNLNCNRQIAGSSVWTSLRVKNSRGIQSLVAVWGDTLLWVLPPGAHQVLRLKIREKFLTASGREMGKVAIVK